ncbi:MAG: hypothetical protein DRJ50_04020 [Actinobacteria bacterium]|nr:MAG: hypothetical protein DRJ50_04020 [Actinomycetota bacterium]
MNDYLPADPPLPAGMVAAFEQAQDAAEAFHDAACRTLDDFTASAYEGVPGVVIIEIATDNLSLLTDLVEEHWA